MGSYKSRLFHTVNIKEQMNSQTENYAIFVDVSGSTGSSDNYWKAVNDIISLHAPQISNYYEWDDEIRLVDKKLIQLQIDSMEGKGGTSPEVVANQIKNSGYKNIILITDGQVGDHSVKECDKILDKYQFNKTICYIIASSEYGGLNMSVTCPFSRNCQNQVYEKYVNKPMKKLVQYTPEDYKILDTLDDISIENFEANFEKIQGLIIALNMGKEGNIPLKNQLVVMRKRLLKEFSKKNQKPDLITEVKTHLEKGDIDGALKLFDGVCKDYLSNTITLDLGKKINYLIGLCGDLRGQYDLNQIKSNKAAHADDAKEGEIDKSVNPADISKNLVECPIIMDEDVPQILVDECTPILVGVEKSIVDDITSCPLRILNYPDIKKKLKERLSNYMGVKYSDKFLKNPFTQRKLLGAIPLGSHKSHTKVGDYTIAKMFSDGKILGNLNLFYAVIWYMIKENQIEYLKDIQKNATQHLVYRIMNSRTMASLCGLPQFVNTQVPSDIAVWFCVNSAYFNLPPSRDTFRFHIYNMELLMEITRVLGYPIHKGIIGHFNRTKALLNILEVLKRSSSSARRNFKEGVRGLYQNSIEIDCKNIGKQFAEKQTVINFVPIDGQATEQKRERVLSLLPECLRLLPLDEIIKIEGLLDTQKLASDIQIQYDFQRSLIPAFQTCWPDLEICQDLNQKINPKTFRVEYGNQEKKLKKPVNSEKRKNKLKVRKHFEQFLMSYKKMPTKDELILFLYGKYCISKNMKALPGKTSSWIEELLNEYHSSMKGQAISEIEVVRRVKQARELDKKIK